MLTRLEEMSGQACWYAVHTRSNFEQRVAGELGRKGFESYLPAYEETHQWRDRKKQVAVPLFPGYLFVRFVDSQELRLPVLRATGVPGDREEYARADIASDRRRDHGHRRTLGQPDRAAGER